MKTLTLMCMMVLCVALLHAQIPLKHTKVQEEKKAQDSTMMPSKKVGIKSKPEGTPVMKTVNSGIFITGTVDAPPMKEESPSSTTSASGTTTSSSSNTEKPVYTLISASVQVTTGSDHKVQGSNAQFELVANPTYSLFESLYNNIAFPTGVGNVINLMPRPGSTSYSNLDNFRSGGHVDIFFDPNRAGSAGTIASLIPDTWIIKDVKIMLKCGDQGNNERPYTLEYKDINATLRPNEQRLRLPFIYNGNEFLPGGAFMPR